MLIWGLLCLFARADEDALMTVLSSELERTMSAWSGQDEAPYFVSYRVIDEVQTKIRARSGALAQSDVETSRDFDVQVRVGSPQLDNTHPIRSDGYSSRNYYYGISLPIDGDARAVRSAVWAHTAETWRKARQAFVEVQANQRVKVEEEEGSADFIPMPPVRSVGAPAALELNVERWERTLVEISALLDDHPEVYRNNISLIAEQQDRYILTSEGTRIRQPRTWVRVALSAETRAEDGMDLRLYRWKDVPSADELPSPVTLKGWAESLVEDLIALRHAPKQPPYSGPVLLRGAAAGVFVHEVMGHRVEGHRQKREQEGQTFKDLVGTRLLPSSISIVDDPTLQSYAGFSLNGHYAFDEEGTPASRAVLVDRGVFKGFLMSRSPIEGYAQSNGHGRAQSGRQPVARMANTILTTEDPKSDAQLRRMLVTEARRAGQEWALVVEDLAGGFTLTGRVFPNTYNIRAVTARRVFVDGRPDEMVRGIDLVGTPLVALQNVVAAGDDPAVFNGFCGAESGAVPNAAVSPSLLLRTQEIQRKEKGTSRPPLLSKPSRGGAS